MAETIMAAKNSFAEGLIMDFAPDNTQATCMTSALNATLITFNGNEMSLQNDMGNGRVETARLPDGYVPIGTCEFGDIIYIVSYNPIINKSQIGCFPSPERNISSDELGGLQQSLSWKDFQEGTRSPNGLLKTSSVKKILYDSKDMSPGDKYIIYSEDLKKEESNKYLSDYNNPTHKHGTFPKLAKIHVVSIEESGKIVYLDSTTKWYDNDYYLNADLSISGGIKDLDSYRTMVSSAYSIFSSKVSGKLALLIELEKITGFSCSWEPFIEKVETSGNQENTQYSIYWNFNWTTDDNNINPNGAVLTCSEWTGVDKDKGGQYQLWEPNGSALQLKSWSGTLPCPTAYPNNGYYECTITRKYKPEDAITFDIFINDGYEYNTYLTSEIQRIKANNNSGIEPYKLNIYKQNGIPQQGTYLVNGTNVIEGVYYTTNSVGKLQAIERQSINDDIVNNYFHYPITKFFSNQFSIPTKQKFNISGVEVTKEPNISNLIYHYKIAPTMPYGILSEYTQEGYIDFSKIGKKSIALNTWKYYNFENTSTLTWGMEAYTEPGKGISEVVFEFYDNQGFVAAYHTKGKNSYNGTFTEYITLNETGSNYKLNNVDHTGTIRYHKGVETLGSNTVTGVTYLDTNGNKVSPQNINSNATYYQDDSGTLYSNFLYLVKIIIKYCNKGILDEYVESDDYIQDYRWYWTNPMFNEHYYSVKDFKDLQAILNFDCNAVYKQSNSGTLNTEALYQGISNTDNTELNNNEYTQLKANITYINQGKNTEADTYGNIQCNIQSGLYNNYNTFNLNSKQLSNIKVKVHLGKAYMMSEEQPQIISNNDLGYVFEGIYPTNSEDINNPNFIAKIDTTYGKLLNELLGNSGGTNNEINSKKDSYLIYKNMMSLTFPSRYNQIGTENIQYLLSFNEECPEEGIKCSTFTTDLGQIEYNFGNSYLGLTFTGILYSKFYELKKQLTTNAKIVRPLLYDETDLERYNMSFNDNSFYFINVGGVSVGDDGEKGDRTRIKFWKASADVNNGQVSNFGDFFPDFYSTGRNAENFITSSIQQTSNGTLNEVFPGITPFVLMKESETGKDYRITRDVNDAGDPHATASQEYLKYFTDNISYLNKNKVQGVEFDLKKIDNYNSFVILALKDSENQLHLLNTFIPVTYSSERYISQNIRYKSGVDSSLYKPTTVGDAIASLLMNLYYTNGETAEVPYYGSYNFVYLRNHSYIFTKDVIYKIYSDISDHKDLLLIQGIYYKDYLTQVITNSQSNNSIINDTNVDIKIESIQKNCPVQFQYNYVIPIQLMDIAPSQVIKCSDGQTIVSNTSFATGKFYTQDLKDPNVFNRLNDKATLYYNPYINIKYSDNSQFIGTRDTEKIIKNEDFIKGFSINDNQLVCKNIGPSSANGTNSITINGKDEDWSGIYPLFKAENLLSMGKLT